MKTVVLRGASLTMSGYGVHTRQIARWLLSRQGIDVDVKFLITPWGDTPWCVDAKAYDGLAGEIMKRGASPEMLKDVDVSIQLQLPNEWDPKLAKFNVGVTAAVETDKCNPVWVDACNTMDLIIVPSEHAKKCLTNSGNVTKPIVVVPEAYSDAIASEKTSELPEFSTKFNFLVFGQLTGNNPYNDRKNTFNTIKWLCEAFKDDPDVGIVVKTNVGRNTKIDRNIVKNLFQVLTREVRTGSNPKIHLLHGDMSDTEVASLYRHPQIKALVALTRGEGYGLPILEAASSGLPVIATDWSGHLDFMKHGKFISIYYQLGELHPTRVDNTIFMKNARWANPEEEDFKKRVVKFRGSSDIPKQWAGDLKKVLLEKYSFEAISKAYDEAFKEVL